MNIKGQLEKGAGWLLERLGVRTVAFEVTQHCNQTCKFCYNVWKTGDYCSGQLDTARTKELLDKILAYRPYVISFTGGEPLLRDDLPELIAYASQKSTCNLITNGTLMSDKTARKLVTAGVKLFEFTLLSADRDIHNALVGRDSFDELIEAIASVRAAGGKVVTTFVAMRQNIQTWPETIELNIALGVQGILFNRFNVGGEGIKHAAELMPSIDELKTALTVANDGVDDYGIGISCGVPIPPCVLDQKLYPNVKFSDCAIGTRRAYPAVDPLGNVRPCNHSPQILGNLFDNTMHELLNSTKAKAYAGGAPTECKGCKSARTCRGGCRAASDACGLCGQIDPFVTLCKPEDET